MIDLFSLDEAQKSKGKNRDRSLFLKLKYSTNPELIKVRISLNEWMKSVEISEEELSDFLGRFQNLRDTYEQNRAHIAAFFELICIKFISDLRIGKLIFGKPDLKIINNGHQLFSAECRLIGGAILSNNEKLFEKELNPILQEIKSRKIVFQVGIRKIGNITPSKKEVRGIIIKDIETLENDLESFSVRKKVLENKVEIQDSRLELTYYTSENDIEIPAFEGFAIPMRELKPNSKWIESALKDKRYSRYESKTDGKPLIIMIGSTNTTLTDSDVTDALIGKDIFDLADNRFKKNNKGFWSWKGDNPNKSISAIIVFYNIHPWNLRPKVKIWHNPNPRQRINFEMANCPQVHMEMVTLDGRDFMKLVEK